MATTRSRLVVWISLFVLAFAIEARAQSGVWIGQDGHDLVGPSSVQEPSGVQDIRISLRGLPPQAVESATIRGLGGDEWRVNGPFGPWKAALVRSPGASSADLYLEPGRVESGRPFTVDIRFSGGPSARIDVRGGRAEPDLRMPGTELAVRWLGQDGQDRTGIGPSVGPDGRQDVHLALANLSPRVEVKSVVVESPGLVAWESGTNPKGRNNAEFLRKGDDPGRADLFFQSDDDLVRRPLVVKVAYGNGKSDSARITGGKIDPKLAMPGVSAPSVEFFDVKARWIGQDGSVIVGGGDIHVEVSGLPKVPAVAAALSDPGTACWAWRGDSTPSFEAGMGAEPLSFRQGADPTRADLFFPPLRDESGGSMTLRLLLRDGRTVVTHFPGGPADPSLRLPAPSSTRATAHPGDDLNELASRVGNLHLSAGDYLLDRTLILSNPIAITAEKGVTLRFCQASDAPPWTAAIKVHCGRTSLDGFSVRFDGPVRWDRDVPGGPAVIGATDERDRGAHPLKIGVSLTRLDLEGPPVEKPWEQAPNLMRFPSVSGRIEENRLKGGSIELGLGPWSVKKNVYRGTVANTTAQSVFSVHRTHDLTLEANRTLMEPGSGKTWRFLVMTGEGVFDAIRDNVVEGVGPRDDDKVPADNAPEIFLTESYRVRFEGMPSSVSSDGRILVIPPPQGEPPRTGDLVAILSGPEAGRFRRIAQAMGSGILLLDEPLPPGRFPVSIAGGFVGESFERNRVDTRGSSGATNLVLAGNHFGTRVVGNRFLGGGDAWLMTACPTEGPIHWGWSHAPMLGLVVEGNTIEDALHGGKITVPHDAQTKSSRGRVYASVSLRNTAIRWTDGFVRHASATRTPLVGLKIGHPDSLDPGELLLSVSGNRVEGPWASKGALMMIDSGKINGKETKKTWVRGAAPR